MKTRKFWRKFRGRLLLLKISFKDWWAWHCPKIRTPLPEMGVCPYCGKPEKLHAYLIGDADGWDMWFDCEDECRANSGDDLEDCERIGNWWPFYWGAACNNEDLRKRGIITH